MLLLFTQQNNIIQLLTISNMQFMTPRTRNKFDDESQLILNSPTSSDGDGNSIINGNTEVGFVFPSVNLKKTPVHQVSNKKFFDFCNL